MTSFYEKVMPAKKLSLRVGDSWHSKSAGSLKHPPGQSSLESASYTQCTPRINLTTLSLRHGTFFDFTHVVMRNVAIVEASLADGGIAERKLLGGFR